jgi:hypothetical protein
MRARLLVLSFVPLSAVIFSAACTIVDELKVADQPIEAGGGGDDASAASDADAGACGAYGYPDPPTMFASGDNLEIRVAVQTVDFGVIDGGPAVSTGYNLDLVCTCPQAQSCVVSDPSNMNCDDPGNGVDNSLGKLVNGPAKVDGLDVVGNAQRSLLYARNGILFRLSQYNGMPDDSAVTLSIYASGGPATLGPDGGAGMPVNPTFTKSDIWTVDRNSLVGGADPAVYAALTTTTAYVSEGVMVARDIDFTLRLDENISITMATAAVTAKIENRADGYHFTNGLIVGRWPVVQALRMLGTLTPPGMDSGRVCDDPSAYDSFKKLLCNAADISSTGPDNAGRVCDAISVGIHFEAVPATFGPPVDLPPAVAPCTEAEAGSDFYVCN